jgi:hypothetical protein
MREKGVRFIPIYGRQAFKIEGKFKFWGGLTVEAVGGGPGLIKMLTDAATKRGIEIRYRTRALSLLHDGVRVSGVRVRHDGAESELRSKSVVLACGGFESNSEWRTRYLGPGWDLAKVRGTRFNSETLLPIRYPRQRHRQALRRRRRRLPQLHLRQVRPGGAGAAGSIRVADLRPEGKASAARRVQDPADYQGRWQHDRGIRAQA